MKFYDSQHLRPRIRVALANKEGVVVTDWQTVDVIIGEDEISMEEIEFSIVEPMNILDVGWMLVDAFPGVFPFPMSLNTPDHTLDESNTLKIEESRVFSRSKGE